MNLRRWRPRSVRMRLTLWYGGAVGLALLIYSFLVFLFLQAELSSAIKQQLRSDIEVVETMLERAPDGQLRWEEPDAGRDGRNNNERDIPIFEVRGKDGNLLYQSKSFKKATPLNSRFMTRESKIGGLAVTIRTARSTEEFYEALGSLALILILGIPLTGALAGAGGYLLARRALAPVGRMTRQARAITAERLSERLEVENPDDELGELGWVFNETFARLERSFDQLRRFTADASHELRTPLTAIRSVGEVGLRERRSPEQYREIIGSMLEETDHLARLVDSLLTLSRADGGQVPLERKPEDLAALARDVANHLGVLAEEKRQTLQVEVGGEVAAEVDHLVLRQALINLVDNAIKYAPEQSPIRIVARREGGRAIMEVIDQGPGLASHDRARIFERFYRVDKARSRQMGGTGLGLAIARWSVAAHGGTIEVESEEGKGCLFRIVLPG